MLKSGLIGREILASRSPWLHEQEARALGLQLKYDLFDFNERALSEDDLGPTLHRLRDEGYCGVNVTHPFKQSVIALMDELDEGAVMIGAVNTVAMRGGKLVGHNTDMAGFRDSFTRGLPGASLSRVLQLGAGGAGAAVAGALLSLGTQQLLITDVRSDRAEALAQRLQARFPEATVGVSSEVPSDLNTVNGIVNATPIGMAAHPGSPFAQDKLSRHMWVADIVYFPLETQLLRDAKQRGCRVLDGSGMVIAQAALAFEIMTGHRADVTRMARSFHQMPSAQNAD